MFRSVPHKWKADLKQEEDKLDKRKKKKRLAEVVVVSKKEVSGEEIDD